MVISSAIKSEWDRADAGLRHLFIYGCLLFQPDLCSEPEALGSSNPRRQSRPGNPEISCKNFQKDHLSLFIHAGDGRHPAGPVDAVLQPGYVPTAGVSIFIFEETTRHVFSILDAELKLAGYQESFLSR